MSRVLRELRDQGIIEFLTTTAHIGFDTGFYQESENRRNNNFSARLSAFGGPYRLDNRKR